eukprot:COSAG05_NODE_7229_length_840_cov_1.703104_1_plen_61_part_10
MLRCFVGCGVPGAESWHVRGYRTQTLFERRLHIATTEYMPKLVSSSLDPDRISFDAITVQL